MPAAVAAAGPAPEVTAVAVLFAAATIFFGVFPSLLFDFAAHAGRALGFGLAVTSQLARRGPHPPARR